VTFLQIVRTEEVFPEGYERSSP